MVLSFPSVYLSCFSLRKRALCFGEFLLCSCLGWRSGMTLLRNLRPLPGAPYSFFSFITIPRFFLFSCSSLPLRFAAFLIFLKPAWEVNINGETGITWKMCENGGHGSENARLEKRIYENSYAISRETHKHPFWVFFSTQLFALFVFVHFTACFHSCLILTDQADLIDQANLPRLSCIARKSRKIYLVLSLHRR